MYVCRTICLLTFAVLLVSVGTYSAKHRRTRRQARQTNRYGSYGSYSTSLYAPRRRPRPSRNRASTSSSVPNLKLLPNSGDKRTVYTGRYCAYPGTKLVPQRYVNGSQTYLKRVVSHCPWTALYCNPKVSYVIAKRHKYAVRMTEVSIDEWRCCPGFSGPNCENMCYNCSTLAGLNQRIDDLQQQLSNTSPIRGQSGSTSVTGPQGPPGPEGPRGSVGQSGAKGEPGLNGTDGKNGLTGQPGVPGMKGQKGERGRIGLHGFPGMNGDPGPAGAAGEPGVPGAPGPRGEKGDTGDVGHKGEPGEVGIPGTDGADGVLGAKGERGAPGIAGPKGEPAVIDITSLPSTTGERGPLGPEGAKGPPGPPGPPGTCNCPQPPIAPTIEVPGNGSDTCISNGQVYANNDLWKVDNCRECLCLDGEVVCFEILCPVENSCKHKYRPEGYCCQVCCANQGDTEEEGEGSAESGDGVGDGSSETVGTTTTDPSVPTGEEYGGYEYGNYTDYDTLATSQRFRRSFDSFGCPTTLRLSSAGIEAVCQLPRDSGPCRGRFSKYFFNQHTQRCEHFTYGGCEGNANNFKTPDLCQKTCQSQSPSIASSIPPRCFVPIEPRPCNVSEPSYYYDPGVGKCLQYTRGDCQTSDNSFPNASICTDVCKGEFMQHGVTVKSAPKTSAIERERRSLPYKCKFPREEGPCKGLMPRFYYDTDEDRCKPFNYGGCKGNANRFYTPWSCRDTCGGGEPVYHTPKKVSRSLPPLCYLPKKKGPCKGSLQHFYYNPKTDRCQIFVYGGCGGNLNNFEDPEECVSQCGGVPSLVYPPAEQAGPEPRSSVGGAPGTNLKCSMPLEEGPCKAGLYRFFFDERTNLCSVFVYGGCRGNENRFETGEECQKACGGDGFNFTITLQSDLEEQTINETFIRVRSGTPGAQGPPGPKGEKGDRGKRGPRGPRGVGKRGGRGRPGRKGDSGGSSASNTPELLEIKATIQVLKSRILFLEEAFFKNQLPIPPGVADDIEEVEIPNIVRTAIKGDDVSGPTDDVTTPLSGMPGNRQDDGNSS